MDSQQKKIPKINWRRCCVLIGAFLILMPIQFINMWGNISVYAISYFYSEHGGTFGMGTLWLVSATVTVSDIARIGNGYLKCWDARSKICMTIILYNLSVFTLHFSAKYDLISLYYCAFVVMGFCYGLCSVSILKFVTPCSNSEKGFVISGLSFGPCLVDPFVSAYINPENVAPDLQVGEIKLFKEQEIIGRVPSMFLVLGTIFSLCQISGFVMLNRKCPEENAPKEMNNAYGAVSTEGRTAQEGELESGRRAANSTAVNPIRDFAPSQTLRHHAFYILWIAAACESFSCLFLKQFYKLFGQNWIKDDFFLASLGSAIALGSGTMRLVWGVVLDRFNIKTCLVILYSTECSALLLMYFAPQVHKWLYFFSTLTFGCMRNIVFPTYVAAILDRFGEKHFEENFGLLSTGALATMYAMPPLTNFLLTHFGWFSVFALCASAGIAALIAIVLSFPHKNE